jgi:hypothetical protein
MVRQSPEERKKLAKERAQDEAAAAKRLEEEKEKAEEEERQNQLKMKKKEEEDERDRKRAEKANARYKKKREEDAVKNAKEAEEAEKKKQADDEALDAAIAKAAKNMNMDEDEDMESSGDEDGQPKKKKKRKDKEKKKARKERKAATKKSDEAGGALPAGGAEIKSNLRAGKFSPIKPKRLQSTYNHKYKREHVTASKILTTDDKYLELALSCRGFMNEARKVDATFVLEPVDPKNAEGRVEKPAQLPINYTDLTATIKVSEGAKFEKSKPWGNKKKWRVVDEDGMEDPEVYFAFAFSCDVDPDDLIERVIHEWRRQGGNRLELSELECFESETAIVIYNLLHDGNTSTLLKEARRFLNAAKKAEEEEAIEGQFQFAGKPVPAMTMRLGVPKIPGLDTSQFNDWDWRDAHKRKALHFECAKADVAHIQELVRIAKARNLVEPCWGNNVRLSNVIAKKSRRKRGPADEDPGHHLLDKHKSYSARHINYHASMVSKGLAGILDIDKKVDITSESDPTEKVGEMSLRGVLYNLKMQDGHTLLGEIHQGGPMMNVDVVVGNTPGAERMVEMMNKNVAAYLTHTLPSLGIGKTFVKNLLKASIDPSLIHEMAHCTWDAQTSTLTTPKDAAAAKKKNIEDAAWYQKDFGAHIKKKGKEQKEYVAPEDVYNLDDDHTFKTLNERPGKYKGTPGAATINLGKEKGPGVIDVDADEDNMSRVSAMTGMSKDDLITLSKDDLIQMLIKKGNISERVGKKGSAPIEIDKSRCEASDDEESSSSDDSDSSFSSSDGAGSDDSAAGSG